MKGKGEGREEKKDRARGDNFFLFSLLRQFGEVRVPERKERTKGEKV